MEPTDPPPADSRSLTPGSRFAGGLGVVFSVALMTWQLGCSHETAPVKTLDARSYWDRQPGGAYVGSASCKECHVGESAQFVRSGHARTFRDPSQLAVARELDGKVADDPERPSEQWAYHLTDQEFWIEHRGGQATDRFKVDFALGSGHNAVTFLTMTDRQKSTALEHRLTYFAQGQVLSVTPGQEAERPSTGLTAHGRELTSQKTIKCLGCHATPSTSEGKAGSLNSLTPNVQCERCHGPGRSHVEAARAGRQDLRMPFGVGRWSADQQMFLCGECHRHPSKASPGEIRREDPSIVRFQPVGIMMSDCYTKSAGEFSCVTCHDPHRRVSSDTSAYEAACLSCHKSAPKKVCPTSPKNGCLGCHMPRINSGQGVLYTDHWIRTRTASDPQPEQ